MQQYQVTHALLHERPEHWLRTFGEEWLYEEWDHDLLVVADQTKVDSRTLDKYLTLRSQLYPVT